MVARGGNSHSNRLFILENGKPLARVGRKAMDPPRAARLPKG